MMDWQGVAIDGEATSPNASRKPGIQE